MSFFRRVLDDFDDAVERAVYGSPTTRDMRTAAEIVQLALLLNKPVSRDCYNPHIDRWGPHQYRDGRCRLCGQLRKAK